MDDLNQPKWIDRNHRIDIKTENEKEYFFEDKDILFDYCNHHETGYDIYMRIENNTSEDYKKVREMMDKMQTEIETKIEIGICTYGDWDEYGIRQYSTESINGYEGYLGLFSNEIKDIETNNKIQ